MTASRVFEGLFWRKWKSTTATPSTRMGTGFKRGTDGEEAELHVTAWITNQTETFPSPSSAITPTTRKDSGVATEGCGVRGGSSNPLNKSTTASIAGSGPGIIGIPGA